MVGLTPSICALHLQNCRRGETRLTSFLQLLQVIEEIHSYLFSLSTQFLKERREQGVSDTSFLKFWNMAASTSQSQKGLHLGGRHLTSPPQAWGSAPGPWPSHTPHYLVKSGLLTLAKASCFTQTLVQIYPLRSCPTQTLTKVLVPAMHEPKSALFLQTSEGLAPSSFNKFLYHLLL